MVENLDALKCGGWEVFIAPTTKITIGEGFCRMAHCTLSGAPATSPGRWVPTVGASDNGATGQSGSAPDRSCSLSGAPSAPALTSARAVVHCSVLLFLCRRPLAWTTDAPLAHRTVRCYTGQSGATPDSPVNYSGAASPNSRRWQVWSGTPWCTGHCPVVHRTVRCARPGLPLDCLLLFLFEPFLGLFIGLC
jgi:hypothetical protein